MHASMGSCMILAVTVYGLHGTLAGDKLVKKLDNVYTTINLASHFPSPHAPLNLIQLCSQPNKLL
jgi:hypothetical protein